MERPFLEWSDDFLIGIEELDYEHQGLIDDINRLHRELVEHDDIDRIKDTLGSIHARMQAHFALEEHVMVSNEYQYYPAHKAEHDQLLDEYTEFMIRFERTPNINDRQTIENMLRHWVTDHIITSDKMMGMMVNDT